MNAGRARHLRETLDRAFDILAGDHHQIGHLVDDHDDEGQRRQLHRLMFVDRFAGLAVEARLHGARDVLALGLRLGRRAH